MLSSDSELCSNPSRPSALLSLGKMLLAPVQLGQGPRSQEVTFIFYEKRDRHTSSFGQKAVILRTNANSAKPPGKTGLIPSQQWGSGDGNQTRTING